MTKIWNVCTLCLRWKMENPSFFNAKFNQQTYNIYCYNSETLLIWDLIFLLSSFFNCFPVLGWAKSIVVREVLLMTLLMGRDCWPQWATPLLTSRVNWIIRLMACWMSSKLGTITCGKKAESQVLPAQTNPPLWLSPSLLPSEWGKPPLAQWKSASRRGILEAGKLQT